MAFYFKDLDEFIKDVRAYSKELYTPVVDEKGEEKIRLIDFAGNPTEDESIFASRQDIFMHFENLYNAYMESTDEPSVENFNAIHAMNLISSSSTLRKLFEFFDDTMDEMKTELKKLEEFKQYILNDAIPATQVPFTETDSKRIVDEMYELAFKMKKCIQLFWENNNTVRLMGFVMGYVSSGRDFFKNKIWAEDPFTSQIEKRVEVFEKIRKMLKFNARCDSVKEMITTIN